MQLTKQSGTGESCSSIPENIRVDMTNKPVSLQEARLLADSFSILFGRHTPIEVYFVYNKEWTMTWGSANWKQNWIRLNRHAVGILLHELAHIFSPQRGHGPAFGKTLDQCYGFYLSYLKTKEANNGHTN